MRKEIKKILVIRFSSIGDIVLTTPVVRCLKKQLHGVKVHFCTKKQYAYLVENNPYIDKIHLLNHSLGELKTELKTENFDYIIDLHNNIITFLMKLSLRVKGKRYDKLRLQRQLLALLPIPLPKPNHVVDRYMKTLEELGISYDGEGLDFFIDEKDEIEDDWLRITHRNGYVAFVMGGTAYTKILPIEKMIELCDKINRPIILIGGRKILTKVSN